MIERRYYTADERHQSDRWVKLGLASNIASS